MSGQTRSPSPAESTQPARWPESVPVLLDTMTGITLRAHTEADLTPLWEQSIDPETVRWTVVPTPYSVADAAAFVSGPVAEGWNRGTQASWAIEAEIDRTRRYCGTIELRYKQLVRTDPETGQTVTTDGLGEIAFALHPAARGRSLMSAAARLVIAWGFDVAGLAAIRWSANVGNWGSRRVAAAAGMVDQGVQRAALPRRGRMVDAWTATITRNDARTSRLRPEIPVLQGSRARLRAPLETDVARMVEGSADEGTQHWLAGIPSAYGAGQARGFIEVIREWEFLGLHWSWVIADPATDELLGSVTLFRLGDEADHGEIGYWLHPDARGRGVAAEAVTMVADLALADNGPHHSLTIRTARGNQRSGRVAEAAGFTQTGYAAGAERLRDGSHPDLLIYSRVGSTH